MTFKRGFVATFILSISWPTALLAATPSTALPDYGSTLVRILGISLAVCALAFILIKHGLPKLQPPTAGRLKLIERLSIGPSQSVVLVEIDGSPVALGVTPHGISALGSSRADNLRSFSDVLNDATMFHVKHSHEEEA